MSRRDDLLVKVHLGKHRVAFSRSEVEVQSEQPVQRPIKIPILLHVRVIRKVPSWSKHREERDLGTAELSWRELAPHPGSSVRRAPKNVLPVVLFCSGSSSEQTDDSFFRADPGSAADRAPAIGLLRAVPTPNGPECPFELALVGMCEAAGKVHF